MVDDCSSDDTHNILKENSIPFSINEKNTGGPNVGRNKCLNNVTGDVICFIDHDDLWEREKIMKQLEMIKEVPIVSTGYKVIDSTAEVKEVIRGNNCSAEIQYPLMIRK